MRGYYILVQMGNEPEVVLNYARSMQPHILKSSPVQDALAFFSDYHSSSYAQFFQRLRRTSYLNACLLHSYFSRVCLWFYVIVQFYLFTLLLCVCNVVQVRQEALQIMNRSFGKGVRFPLAELQVPVFAMPWGGGVSVICIR
jgi:hypothetical protein